MTDLLESQAIIKSHRQVIRDTSGRFAPDIHTRIAAKLLRERLARDVRALEHARGVVYERGHFHALPGAKLHAIETVAPVEETVDPMPLFHQRAA